MKPNGLVAAASITSQTSMPIALVDDLELVHQRDVDGAEDVLGELRGLGRVGRGDRHGADHDCVVERAGEPERRRVVAADDLGDARGREVAVARVLALGARRRGRSRRPRARPVASRIGLHHLAGGAGIGGRLSSTTSWPGRERPGDRVARSPRRSTGPARAAASSGVGTQMRIASGSPSRPKSAVASNRPGRAPRPIRLVADVLDVALAAVERVDLGAGRCRSRAPGSRPPVSGQRQRQADVAQARSQPDRPGPETEPPASQSQPSCRTSLNPRARVSVVQAPRASGSRVTRPHATTPMRYTRPRSTRPGRLRVAGKSPTVPERPRPPAAGQAGHLASRVRPWPAGGPGFRLP